MRCTIVLAFATAMLFSCHSTAVSDAPSPGKQFQFNLRVLEGDPLGSLEEGTLKVLAEPRLITLENQSFSFHSGGEVTVRDDSRTVERVPFGRMIEGKRLSHKVAAAYNGI